MPRIHIRGHVLYAGKVPWRAWGFNWGGGDESVITYFDDPSAARLNTLAAQLRTAHALGADSMRVFLELGQVMQGPGQVRTGTLLALKRLLKVAERERMYLEIVGNLVWRPALITPWYDLLSEADRWEVQAEFWKAVAHAASSSPAVLSYELTSEPIVANGSGYYYGWVDGWSFVQSIADGQGRDAVAIARAWTRKLADAVRSEDDRPVTIGFLPTLSSPIRPATVGDLLDLFELHVYPGQTPMSDAVRIVRNFGGRGKPVLIGETGILFCDWLTERRFLVGAARYVNGVFAWFDGRDPNRMKVSTIADALYRLSLELFITLRSALLHA
jgi:hypothetical protein